MNAPSAQTITPSDIAMLEELGAMPRSKPAAPHTQRQLRIIAGFEEIQRFVQTNNRLPSSAETRDIFERIYAVRLDRLRQLQNSPTPSEQTEPADEYRALLHPLDHQKLLADSSTIPADPETLDDSALLTKLGITPSADQETTDFSDITTLRHVRSTAERQAAEEIANRQPCRDFKTFKPFFDQLARDLRTGTRKSRQIRKHAGFAKTDLTKNQCFILNGQTLLIAEIGETFKAPNGEPDARLRIIYSNATESNLLLRSLQRALYKDETSRIISATGASGPLFSPDPPNKEDLPSGTIYVLRSKSTHPAIVENRESIHKIGVTNNSTKRRIANARRDPTFLRAEVETVATCELFNINATKLEKLIHKIFKPARLDIQMPDRFNNSVSPREWFLVPLPVIAEAIQKIQDNSITNYIYDPTIASLVKS